jgi:hypothetical protein
MPVCTHSFLHKNSISCHRKCHYTFKNAKCIWVKEEEKKGFKGFIDFKKEEKKDANI